MKNTSTNLILSLFFIGLCFFTSSTIAAPISEGDSTVTTQESVSPPIDQKKAKQKKKWWNPKKSPRKTKQQCSARKVFKLIFLVALIAAVVFFLIGVMVLLFGGGLYSSSFRVGFVLIFIALYGLAPLTLVAGIGWWMSFAKPVVFKIIFWITFSAKFISWIVIFPSFYISVSTTFYLLISALILLLLIGGIAWWLNSVKAKKGEPSNSTIILISKIIFWTGLLATLICMSLLAWYFFSYGILARGFFALVNFLTLGTLIGGIGWLTSSVRTKKATENN